MRYEGFAACPDAVVHITGTSAYLAVALIEIPRQYLLIHWNILSIRNFRMLQPDAHISQSLAIPCHEPKHQLWIRIPDGQILQRMEAARFPFVVIQSRRRLLQQVGGVKVQMFESFAPAADIVESFDVRIFAHKGSQPCWRAFGDFAKDTER